MMKRTGMLVLWIICGAAYGQTAMQKDTLNNNPNYDQALAGKTGADAYGMKTYFLVILKTGSDTTRDTGFIRQSFRGHLANIQRLTAQGKMVVAGPLFKNENGYRGIFILQDVQTREAADSLLQTDPAIKNRLLDYDLYTWYGSAALPEYLPYADKVWRSRP